MEHGLDATVIAVVAASTILWSLVSATLERRLVTAPIAFVAMGLVLANGPLAVVEIELESATVRSIAEITLVLVLFVDASRVNVRALRADTALPLRLLAIGLPLTIFLGAMAGMLVSGGASLWLAALIGAIVAPTDAALGGPIMKDTRVPPRIRRVLNVESGLNDGIATPFVGVFLAGAVAAESTLGNGAVRDAIWELGKGAGLGIAIGALGALLVRVCAARGYSAAAFRPLAPLALALLSYGVALELEANGFVAAFVAGMAFGTVLPKADAPLVKFADEMGELLSLLTWFIFGAALVVPALEHASWRDAVFAVLALTVIRMLPVAVASIGLGLDRRTVAFIGWFGPRGLASVVFAMLAVDSLDAPDAQRVLSAAGLTVLASVVLHGVTASPLAARYGASVAGLNSGRPEHAPAPDVPTRSLSARPRHPAPPEP